MLTLGAGDVDALGRALVGLTRRRSLPGGEPRCMVRRIPWRVPAGVALAAIGLLLGFLWFRDSSFAAVEQVVVTGSGSSEGERVIARARGGAARG